MSSIRRPGRPCRRGAQPRRPASGATGEHHRRRNRRHSSRRMAPVRTPSPSVFVMASSKTLATVDVTPPRVGSARSHRPSPGDPKIVVQPRSVRLAALGASSKPRAPRVPRRRYSAGQTPPVAMSPTERPRCERLERGSPRQSPHAIRSRRRSMSSASDPHPREAAWVRRVRPRGWCRAALLTLDRRCVASVVRPEAAASCEASPCQGSPLPAFDRRH